MMENIYIIRMDKSYDEDGKEYNVYGIDAIDLNGNTVMSIPDVFFDRTRAEVFVKLCNDNGLSLVHLNDVVEDELAK